MQEKKKRKKELGKDPDILTSCLVNNTLNLCNMIFLPQQRLHISKCILMFRYCFLIIVYSITFKSRTLCIQEPQAVTSNWKFQREVKPDHLFHRTTNQHIRVLLTTVISCLLKIFFFFVLFRANYIQLFHVHFASLSFFRVTFLLKIKAQWLPEI